MSSGSPYLSLIVPAYNEVRAIGRTLHALRGYLDRQGYGYEIIVSADGDDGTREAVAELAARGLAESRIEVPQPLHRRLGSKAFGLVMHLILGLWDLHDTQCGFKFFRGPVARDLFGRQRIDGYMFDVEVLHLAARSGYRIKEVGVSWRDDGDSRLQLVRGNWRNFLDILRIRFGRRPCGGPAGARHSFPTEKKRAA
ncbi:MAG: glycosyltransferase [Planctomycetes bacterium]|nr:glycosyltransferase [Planctomycetota bacterium]